MVLSRSHTSLRTVLVQFIVISTSIGFFWDLDNFTIGFFKQKNPQKAMIEAAIQFSTPSIRKENAELEFFSDVNERHQRILAKKT